MEMRNDELQAALGSVIDEETFVVFLEALALNREKEKEIEKLHPSSPWGPGTLGWENGSIESFLSAAATWAVDSKDGTVGGYEIPDNPWKRCADIIFMGKIYE